MGSWREVFIVLSLCPNLLWKCVYLGCQFSNVPRRHYLLGGRRLKRVKKLKRFASRVEVCSFLKPFTADCFSRLVHLMEKKSNRTIFQAFESPI